MSLRGCLEALLFAAGRSMPAAELARLVETPVADVEAALEVLAAEYRDRDGGIALMRGPAHHWSFDIRRRYAPLVSPVLAPEIEGPLLRTLSLIALLQPVEQAKIVERRGDRAYAHIRQLVRDALIERRRKGRGYVLQTSPAFARRFSLPQDPEEVRRALAKAADLPEGEPAGAA